MKTRQGNPQKSLRSIFKEIYFPASISKSTSLDKEDISRPSLKRSAKVDSEDTVQDSPENSEVTEGDQNFLEVCIEEQNTDIPEVGVGIEHGENNSNNNSNLKLPEKVSRLLHDYGMASFTKQTACWHELSRFAI